jgi:aminoglycoside phosphotransferase (APT) family kinase protein
MASDRFEIDALLVARLVAEQFPQWAGLPVRKVHPGGWDNRTFRLGEEMSVRLPSAPGYVAQVDREHRWLPRLAPHLPLPIPAPTAKGEPSKAFPWPWSVYRWLDGEPALTAHIADQPRFAADLAGFLAALYRIDSADGPPAGLHNFYRGGPLTVYDAETRQAIATLSDEIDPVIATEVWEAGLRAAWHGPPVWVHGDVAAGNLLVDEGELSAVIDFGSSGVGDPACDTVIAWTFLDGEAREAFRALLPIDHGTWARGRGWALWKVLITVAWHRESEPEKADEARRVLHEVIADHRRFG